MYGLTTCCLKRFSASHILSMVAYVRRHWRSVCTLPVSRPSLNEPSRLNCSMVVMLDILCNFKHKPITPKSSLGIGDPLRGVKDDPGRRVTKTFFSRDESGATHRPYFLHQWQATTLVNIELELIELCGYSLNQLATQLTGSQHKTCKTVKDAYLL